MLGLMEEARKRFITKDLVTIGGKDRPVFFTGGWPNITIAGTDVSVLYNDGNVAKFKVGKQESAIIDCVLVWLIDPKGAHAYS
jgi:hypothetical protein